MMKDSVDRAWHELRAMLARVDWEVVAMVVAFFAVAPFGALLGKDSTNVLEELAQRANPDHVAYESSIAAAATKRPDYVVPLQTIEPASAMVNVVSFGPRRTPPESDRTFDIWVALPGQLRDACAGATDPMRRLEQILGLPPVSIPDRVVTELAVPRDGLFRPCVAGGDLAAPRCAMDFPDPLAADAPPGAVREAYDRMRFVTAQMWNSYRLGFRANRKSSADYPGTGYPFTGMGWTYDWSDAPNHVGVSEFVVTRNAKITVVGTKTPAEFCGAAAPAK